MVEFGVGTSAPIAEGQSQFTLPRVPSKAEEVLVIVDGVPQHKDQGFTLSGSIVTISIPGVSLGANDYVRIYY